jgi:glucose/mannose transport system permease protein
VRSWKRTVQITAFLLPAIVLVAIFVYIFLGWSTWNSLTDWKGLGGPGKFVGLKNYIKMFTNDRIFIKTLRNTLVLSAIFIGGTIPLGLFNAILLDLSLRGRRVFRLIYLIPLSFSFVVSATMWLWMYAPESGAINTLLRMIGLGSLAQPWITSSSQSIPSIALIYIWQFSGFATLVYYAGIAGVPQQLIEAALVDGASTFRKYLSIIIPLQRSATITTVVLLLMYSLRVFDLVWLTTGGGPGYSSQILSTYMWRVTFNRNQFAYGAAIGVFMFFLSMAILIPFFAIFRRGEEVS